MRQSSLVIYTIYYMLSIVGCGLPSDRPDSASSPDSAQSIEGDILSTTTGGKIIVLKETKKIPIPVGHNLHGFTADSNGYYMVTGASAANLNFTKSTGKDLVFTTQCAITESGLIARTGMAWDGNSIYLIKGNNDFIKFSGADCSKQSTINLGLSGDVAQPPFTVATGKIYWNRSSVYDLGQSPPTSTVGGVLSETDLVSGLSGKIMSNVTFQSNSTQFGNNSGASSVVVPNGVISMTASGSVLWVLFAKNWNMYLWKITKLGEVIGWVEIPTSVLTSTVYEKYFIGVNDSANLVLANENEVFSATLNPTVTFTTIDVSGF